MNGMSSLINGTDLEHNTCTVLKLIDSAITSGLLMSQWVSQSQRQFLNEPVLITYVLINSGRNHHFCMQLFDTVIKSQFCN